MLLELPEVARLLVTDVSLPTVAAPGIVGDVEAIEVVGNDVVDGDTVDDKTLDSDEMNDDKPDDDETSDGVVGVDVVVDAGVDAIS